MNGGHFREETKGWFCKRAVFANVPSFRVLGSRNISIIIVLRRGIGVGVKGVAGSDAIVAQ